MDQAARKGGSTVTSAAEQSPQKSPEELREEIDRTREQLGDTVQALAAKTDVKGQARDRLAAVKEGAQQRKDELVTRARRATPDSAGEGAQELTSTIQRKPVPFAAAGAFTAGMLVGWSLGRR
jgi:chromosome segregation ATPase